MSYALVGSAKGVYNLCTEARLGVVGSFKRAVSLELFQFGGNAFSLLYINLGFRCGF